MHKVFIVVLNWNRKKDTLECLSYIDKLKVKNIELHIVVVDNGSTDGSQAAISNFQFPVSNFQLKLIINFENLGYVGGNNVGMKYSLEGGADWVMVLNNDTRVDSMLLENLLKVAKKYPKAGIISPKIYFEEGYEYHLKRYKESELGNVIWYAGGKFDWDNVLGSNIGVDEVDIGQYEKVREIDFATGACLFLRASALTATGLFDSKYFMYLEDVDLSVRMQKRGFNLIYYPKAKLWHKVGRSSKIGGHLNDYFYSRNRMLFGFRYAKYRAKLALFRESFAILAGGRTWQKKGIVDFYMGRFGKGSWS